MSPAQQVLVKGVQVTSKNVQEVIKLVETQFHILEGRIAHISAMAHEQIDQQKVCYEQIYYTFFESSFNGVVFETYQHT